MDEKSRAAGDGPEREAESAAPEKESRFFGGRLSRQRLLEAGASGMAGAATGGLLAGNAEATAKPLRLH